MNKSLGVAALTVGLVIVLALAVWVIRDSARTHEELRGVIGDLSLRLAVLERGTGGPGGDARQPQEPARAADDERRQQLPARVPPELDQQLQELARRVAKVEQRAGTGRLQSMYARIEKSEGSVQWLSRRLDEMDTEVRGLQRGDGQGTLGISLAQVRRDAEQLDRRVDDLERSSPGAEGARERRDLKFEVRELQREMDSLRSRVSRLERGL